ncbi:hypothetical protein Poli38472_012577 [Pythium oligandrum]|uniref:Uncharacterized protein n=1 Tax=Pythium oligandrum TaxID=41045 RepID=A0A8K1CDG7_PYTOL|nr:hypothetical protein Poli38472_012577 [Pythium oligandrum]|eukprot:TMW61386.1 hypothetical protein Poli38472_012577 [Pythium oligandrum]
MKPRLPKLAMPSLQLSPEEQCAVVEEFEALLAETLAHERQFRSSNVSLDKKHWKEIKSHEDFRVYKERKQKNADPADMHCDTSPSIMASRFLSMRELPIMSTSTVDSSEGDLGFVASVKDPKVPMVVAAGHVEGALKDIVFGALASDDLMETTSRVYEGQNLRLKGPGDNSRAD